MVGARASADCELLCLFWLLSEPNRNLPGTHRTLVHRDPEEGRDKRDKRPLTDDGQEHDDEDDPVDSVRIRYAADHGERREENRDGPLQAAPGDEGALGPTE